MAFKGVSGSGEGRHRGLRGYNRECVFEVSKDFLRVSEGSIQEDRKVSGALKGPVGVFEGTSVSFKGFSFGLGGVTGAFLRVLFGLRGVT